MNNAPLNSTHLRTSGSSTLSGINWPTVMMSAGAAAVIAAIILAIGVVGLSRGNNADGQTIVVQAQESTPLSPGGSSDKARATAAATSAKASEITSSGTGGALSTPTGAAEPQPQSPSATGGTPHTNAVPAEPAEPADESRRWTPASALPADFAVTTQNPSLTDINNIVYFLTATDASDSAKARNIESEDAIIVPQTVSRIGLFRAPRGGSRVTGPMDRNGNNITVQLNAFSAGIPDISMPITFVYLDGTWRLANSSLCNGVRTVGLPIYCNA